MYFSLLKSREKWAKLPNGVVLHLIGSGIVAAKPVFLCGLLTGSQYGYCRYVKQGRCSMTRRLFCLECQCWLEAEQVSWNVADRKSRVHSWFRCKNCGQDHVYYSDHVKTLNAIKLMQKKH
jgi:hypothetical protein